MLCAAALCVSSVACAEPIFTPADDTAAQPAIEYVLPAPKAEFADPQPNYDYLLPAGAGIRDTSYFSGLAERQPSAGFAYSDVTREEEDSGPHPLGVASLCFGATLFVFTIDAWGGRRWRRRRRYRFVLDTKPEYRERAAA